jgi:hypothetical protein
VQRGILDDQGRLRQVGRENVLLSDGFI